MSQGRRGRQHPPSPSSCKYSRACTEFSLSLSALLHVEPLCLREVNVLLLPLANTQGRAPITCFSSLYFVQSFVLTDFPSICSFSLSFSLSGLIRSYSVDKDENNKISKINILKSPRLLLKGFVVPGLEHNYLH